MREIKLFFRIQINYSDDKAHNEDLHKSNIVFIVILSLLQGVNVVLLDLIFVEELHNFVL